MSLCEAIYTLLARWAVAVVTTSFAMLALLRFEALGGFSWLSPFFLKWTLVACTKEQGRRGFSLESQAARNSGLWSAGRVFGGCG